MIRGKNWVNNHAHVLRAVSGVTSNSYVCHYLNLFDFHEYVTGTTRLKLNQSQMNKIPIPLAPLPEQYHIVAKIEEQFTRLDAGVAALKRARANLKRYKAAVLKAACEGKLVAQDPSDEPASELLKRILAERRAKWAADLRAKGKDPQRAKHAEPVAPYESETQQFPESWIVASVDALTSRVTYGITVRPEYVEDGIPVVSAREIRSGTIDFDIAKRISEKDFSTLRSNCKIQENDVLFSKTGSIGHVARVKTSEPLCSSQNIAVLSPLINPAYLELVLRTPAVQRLASKSVKTTAVPDLQLGILKQFPVRLPPESEQRRIVAEVERRLSVVQELDATLTANLARAERLRQSILKRAFEGKL